MGNKKNKNQNQRQVQNQNQSQYQAQKNFNNGGQKQNNQQGNVNKNKPQNNPNQNQYQKPNNQNQPQNMKQNNNQQQAQKQGKQSCSQNKSNDNLKDTAKKIESGCAEFTYDQLANLLKAIESGNLCDEDFDDIDDYDDFDATAIDEDELETLDSVLFSMDEWMESIAPITVSFAKLMSQLCKKYPLVFGFQELFNDIWVLRNLNRNFLPTIYSGASYERVAVFASKIKDVHEKILDTISFLEPFNIFTPALLMEVKETIMTNAIAIDTLMEEWYDNEEEEWERGCENCTDGDCTGCPMFNNEL